MQTGIYPRHKQLMVKQSQRCRQCEHNLSKPGLKAFYAALFWNETRLTHNLTQNYVPHFSEYNPASIKFKIQLSAYYHIPEIKLVRYPAKESLIPGKSIDFVLKFINPTQHPTFIEILDLVNLISIQWIFNYWNHFK